MIKDECTFSDRLSAGIGKNLMEELNLKANMKIELFDETGKLKEIREVHNTVTTAGKAGIMDQGIASPTLPKPGWMELGTGSPAATLLGAYITGSRTALTSKTRATNVITMVADFAAGVGTGAITEAGVFDVVTANTVNMWLSATFAVVNKSVADTLKITWTFTGN
jgi:hypothetical protein